ncbi:fatty acid desaturase 2 isoform X1 [Lingula anatina]|uniref:Fatty acid desaturase 2 isoform X1 n=1 Tax=Lingula anatina TaxID=7574 RepID=A0A2R2MK32_LINAN|nr:fatty acid desaturase 2 isoform X1 [Lingula anatina]|eukprot:XP_023930584.1 fatty acid desaturase 2 isoform X1 [Lingula anatina]
MKPLLVGKVKEPGNVSEIEEDMRSLRKAAEDMGLFKVNPWFYAAHFFSIIACEVIGYLIIANYGTSWTAFLAASFFLLISQGQAGWTQHDYGHLSVFNSRKLNHLMHEVVIGGIKAASSHWWNFRHFQHHVKPNVYVKDPDITLPYVFLLGDKMPSWWGEKKKGFMPYQFQHHYFFLFGPPALLPVYFHIENLYFLFKRKEWWDLFWMLTFFTRWFHLYGPYLGGWGTLGLYFFVRFLESHWFVWVTQMNHIPMDIDKDQQRDWFSQQLAAACNVEPGYFNDWFTGHLNYQIEHHLFPTMPRHNYHKVAPLVKSMCKKHQIPYLSKPLLTAFGDIVRSLKKSGNIWHEAYYDM